MVDFHSHILPQMDDGSGSVSESLMMLRQSFLQGVDIIVSTSHFYADEEYPKDFLKRRKASFRALREAMLMSTDAYPSVALGAEVLYFPGICEAEDVRELMIQRTRTILIEPSMSAWSDAMLDEIWQLGQNFECTPVIAHVDRYMSYLKDDSLMKRVQERDMLVQVNASYFLDPKTVKAAVRHLKNGDIQLIGSDCHNLDTRLPNLGMAWKQAKVFGVEVEFKKMRQNAIELFQRG